MVECPCDKCITKAICMNKRWELILQCPIIRDYVLIDDTGPNYDMEKLDEFCNTMGLKLMKSEPRFESEARVYFIQQRDSRKSTILVEDLGHHDNI